MGRGPAPGTCSVQIVFGAFLFVLDAGAPLTLETPSQTLLIDSQLPTFSRLATSADDLFLGPGSYSISLPGGRDVGAFTASIDVPQPPEVVRDDLPGSVSADDSLTVSWAG